MLKSKTERYKFKLLTPKIFELLGDKTADFDFYYINNLFRIKPNKIQKVYK